MFEFWLEISLIGVLTALALYLWRQGVRRSREQSRAIAFIAAGLALVVAGLVPDIARLLPGVPELRQVLDSTTESVTHIVNDFAALSLLMFGIYQLALVRGRGLDGGAGARRYREVVENANSIILRWGTDGTIRFINPYGEEFFGYSASELKGKNVVGTIVPSTESTGRDLVEMIEDIEENPERYRANENENIRKSGERVWVSWSNKGLRDRHGRLVEVLSIGVDVTERRLAQDALRALAESFNAHRGSEAFLRDNVRNIARAYGVEHAYIGIFADAGKTTIQTLVNFRSGRFVNNDLFAVDGTPCAEVLSRNATLLISSHASQRYPADQRLGGYEIESYFGAPLKTATNEQIGILAIADSHPMELSVWSRPVLGVFASRIAAELERQSAEDHIYRLAHYDPMTRLPNRMLFQDRVRQAILNAQRNRRHLALLFLDLDRFKPINDTLGHGAGDQVLREVAQRLLDQVRESDTVARMGGDEFTLLLENINTQHEVVQTANQTAVKVLRVLSEPFKVGNKEANITASIGIVSFPGDGANFEDLVRRADTAMYHAKTGGKDTYRFYEAGMNAQAAERIKLERDLHEAIGRQEFELYYMPVIDLKSESVHGVEAFLRWRHPRHGLLKPKSFICVAEETGLIETIGDWVLETACRQAARWQGQGLPGLKLYVNLSLRQVRNDDFEGRLQDLVEETGMSFDHLVLELTERALGDDIDRTAKALQKLQDLGAEIALDDFGTGYASLAHLKQLPVDRIKIDRAFTRDVQKNADNAAIVDAIISMVHHMSKIVIAEGVESEAQAEHLVTRGCDLAQGYLFGTACSSSECGDRLRRWLETDQYRSSAVNLSSASGGC